MYHAHLFDVHITAVKKVEIGFYSSVLFQAVSLKMLLFR